MYELNISFFKTGGKILYALDDSQYSKIVELKQNEKKFNKKN